MVIRDYLDLVVLSSNKQRKLLPGLAHQFNKYWPNQEVTVIGDQLGEVILPPNFSFKHVGEDSGPQSWSNLLISFLQEYEKPYIFFCLDDHFLFDYVDTDSLAAGVSHLKNGVAEKLSCSLHIYNGPYAHLAAGYESHPMIDGVFASCPPNSDDTTTLMPSVWNAEFLLSCLIPNRTVQQSEVLMPRTGRTIRKKSSPIFPFMDIVRNGGPAVGFGLQFYKDWCGHLSEKEIEFLFEQEKILYG